MSCKATGCGQCACITSETDPAEVSPATLSAIARAAEIWTHPDNTEASRPALQHPLAPEQPANVAEAFAQLPVRTVDTLAYGDLQRAASTFEGGLVTERYLDRLVACYEEARAGQAERLAHAAATSGQPVKLDPSEVKLAFSEFPLGRFSGVVAVSGRFTANVKQTHGYELKDFYGEKFHDEYPAAASSFVAAAREKDTLTLLANLNAEVASGRLTFHFEQCTTTTYALFTCDGTAVAGFSACIDIRNYTPLLGMVYAAKYIADKLERHYVLDSRAAALSRIKAQAWGCMSFAKRFALPA